MNSNNVQRLAMSRQRADSRQTSHRVPGTPHRSRARNVVRVGVIGYGYWGPNIVRNFHGLDTAQVVAVCDKNPAAL